MGLFLLQQLLVSADKVVMTAPDLVRAEKILEPVLAKCQSYLPQSIKRGAASNSEPINPEWHRINWRRRPGNLGGQQQG